MRKTLLMIAGALLLLAAAAFTMYTVRSNQILTRPMQTPVADSTKTSFYSFTVNSLDGQPVSFEQFRGKKIIVLNTASECGYTPQYADWEKFYAENKDSVVVLAFPCNDFGGQEPGSADDIKSFCQKNYGVTFPMFEKVSVKGAAKSPVQWLTDPAQNGWSVSRMRYIGLIVGGALAAVGGAFLPLANLGLFWTQMTAGRGFIAIAIVIFSRWNPLRGLWGALFFGATMALQLSLQTLRIPIASELLLMLPYIVTIIALVIVSRRAEFPGAFATPYTRSGE